MGITKRETFDKLRAMAAANRPKPLLLVPGEYRCRVARIEEKITGASGGPMLKLALQILVVPKKPLIFAYATLAAKRNFTGDNFRAAIGYDPDQDGRDRRYEAYSCACAIEPVRPGYRRRPMDLKG
jgi:hypothetical protein